MNKLCLITNDVETTSIVNHKLSDETGKTVIEQGLPRLLDLYEQHGVRATFFFTGHIAKLYPQGVRAVAERGHEVGSHGLTHEVSKAFDAMPPQEQLVHLTESKHIIEDIIGSSIVSFRAPAARVPKHFPKVLQEAGFLIDSSVASQRMDMFFSFGSINKLHWLTAPRHAYTTAPDNIFHKGDGGIFEIPISAVGFPYIGTFMRIAPLLNRMTRRILYTESLLNGRQFVFLTHPNEFIDERRDSTPIERRASNWLAYLMGDVIRHALKVRNLGSQALPLMDHELHFFDKKQFKYLTCKDLYNLKHHTHAQ